MGYQNKQVCSCRSKNRFPSIFELHVYELLKILSKVIRGEHPGESINSFIADKEIARSFDTEWRIKTIPLIEKLTRKKRKLISNRLRILYNSLFTLDIDIIKSLRNCKEKNLKKKLLHSFLENYIIDSNVLETCIGSMLDKKEIFFENFSLVKFN